MCKHQLSARPLASTYSTQFLHLNRIVDKSTDLLLRAHIQLAYGRVQLSAQHHQSKLRWTNASTACIACKNLHTLLQIRESDRLVIESAQIKLFGCMSKDVIEQSDECETCDGRRLHLNTELALDNLSHSFQVTCSATTLWMGRKKEKRKNW